SLTTDPCSSIDVVWTDNATGEKGYKAERSADGVSFTQVALLGPNVTTYASTGLTAANTYTHRVRAYDGPNDSGYSNAAAATTLPAPAAPSGLLATPTAPSRIDLAWPDNAANEQGFKVERSTDRVTFTTIASTGVNATSYSVTSLVAGTTYAFRVRAYEGPNDSSPSNTAAATTLAVPATPTGLTATPVSQTRI